jgi:hypothetical protein
MSGMVDISRELHADYKVVSDSVKIVFTTLSNNSSIPFEDRVTEGKTESEFKEQSRSNAQSFFFVFSPSPVFANPSSREMDAHREAFRYSDSEIFLINRQFLL